MKKLQQLLTKMDIRYVKSNGYFGLLRNTYDKEQHPNQQNGLDKYVDLVNFSTGELCSKKLYLNNKGLHFKHSCGYMPTTHYLDDFTEDVYYIPFQIIKD